MNHKRVTIVALAAILAIAPATELISNNGVQLVLAAKKANKKPAKKTSKKKSKKVVKKAHNHKKTNKKTTKKRLTKSKRVKKTKKIKKSKEVNKKKLTRAAYVYDSKGRRVRRYKLIKKGKKLNILGAKSIKNKEYYRIGRNMYIKAANFSKALPKVQQLADSQKQALQQVLDNEGFKGNATVYINGQKSWSSTNANKEDSAYLINSVQKALTSGILMKLVAQKKIKLTDKVAKYYPQVPNANRIIIMNLVEMTSGLTQHGNVGTKPFVSDKKNAKQMIKSMGFDESKYGQWGYQDINFVLLSHILEKVSGKSYEKLFDQTYTNPLKLKNTHFMWSKNKNIAPATKPFDMDETHGLLGAASVAMSNNDLYTVLSGLLNGKLLTAKQKKIIYAPGNSESLYRGGLYTRDGYYSSNGAGYGYYTFVRISKDGKNAIILQTNAGSKYKTARANSDQFLPNCLWRQKQNPACYFN